MADLISRLQAAISGDSGPTEEDYARERALADERDNQFYSDLRRNVGNYGSAIGDRTADLLKAPGNAISGLFNRWRQGEAGRFGYRVPQPSATAAPIVARNVAPPAQTLASPDAPPAATIPAPALPQVASTLPSSGSPQPTAGPTPADQEDQTDLAPVAGQTQPASATPGAPKYTLVDDYRAALDKINKVDTSGTLSPEQRKRFETMFWMQMLAHSSEPGARALGAFGKSGTETIAATTAVEEKNRQTAIEKLKQNKDDLYHVALIADKQGDNERADKQMAALQAHYERTDKTAAEHIRILRDQMGRENIFVIPTPSGYIMYDKRDITNVQLLKDPTTGKPIMPPEAAGADHRSEFGKFMSDATAFSAKPPDEQAKLMALANQFKGAGKEERDRQEEAIGKGALDLMSKDMGGKLTMSQARDLARQAYGLAQSAAGSQKPATEATAQAQARAAVQQGAKKDDVNARLKTWGYGTI